MNGITAMVEQMLSTKTLVVLDATDQEIIERLKRGQRRYVITKSLHVGGDRVTRLRKMIQTQGGFDGQH